MRSLGIHLRELSLDDLKITINKTRLKIAVLKWHPGLPGANELTTVPGSNTCMQQVFFAQIYSKSLIIYHKYLLFCISEYKDHIITHILSSSCCTCLCLSSWDPWNPNHAHFMSWWNQPQWRGLPRVSSTFINTFLEQNALLCAKTHTPFVIHSAPSYSSLEQINHQIIRAKHLYINVPVGKQIHPINMKVNSVRADSGMIKVFSL